MVTVFLIVVRHRCYLWPHNSPTEPTVLASCSVDGSVLVWDLRQSATKAAQTFFAFSGMAPLRQSTGLLGLLTPMYCLCLGWEQTQGARVTCDGRRVAATTWRARTTATSASGISGLVGQNAGSRAVVQ